MAGWLATLGWYLCLIGRLVAENAEVPGPDAGLRFRAPADGEYQLRICDSAFRGNQDYVYRLTVTKGPAVDAVYPLGGRLGETTGLELRGGTLPGVEAAAAVLNAPFGTELFQQSLADFVSALILRNFLPHQEHGRIAAHFFGHGIA